MHWCMVDVICAHCGRRHRLSNEVQVRQPPPKAGTLAEIYGDMMPADLADVIL